MADPKTDRSPTEELAARRRARPRTSAGADAITRTELRIDRLTGSVDDVADQVAALRTEVRGLVTVETKRLEASGAFRKLLLERLLDPKVLGLLIVLVLALAALGVGVPIAVGDWFTIGDAHEEAPGPGE